MSLENFIYESLEELLNGDFEQAKEQIVKHKEIYNDDCAICFTLLALGAFIKKDYNSYFELMKDA